MIICSYIHDNILPISSQEKTYFIFNDKISFYLYLCLHFYSFTLVSSKALAS